MRRNVASTTNWNNTNKCVNKVSFFFVFFSVLIMNYFWALINCLVEWNSVKCCWKFNNAGFSTKLLRLGILLLFTHSYNIIRPISLDIYWHDINFQKGNGQKTQNALCACFYHLSVTSGAVATWRYIVTSDCQIYANNLIIGFHTKSRILTTTTGL